MISHIDDVRIKTIRPLIPPAILLEEIPLTTNIAKTVITYRQMASKIMHGQDQRLLVIVGPCSIHDPEAALAYAHKLKVFADKLQDELCIIMRAYFEKPRTTVGWKGLINDPKLNNSYDVNNGLRIARRLLFNINALGLPTGTEFLDTIIPQYLSDLISWGAIGARTTESQIHRELASGLSMPIGFKNGTTGNIQIAIDAIKAAQHSHHFLSVTKQGIAAIVATRGNDTCHVILRGSNEGSNYDAATIADTALSLEAAHLPVRLMVDCSHGNSNKDYTKQKIVVDHLCEQMIQGNEVIGGVMVESNLVAGKQALHHGENLVYGQSVTDACVSWEDTKKMLYQLAHAVKRKIKKP